MRILLVEDNHGFAFGLASNLEFEGYEVQVANDGEDGLRRATSAAYDLFILDLMLPNLDGYGVLKGIREHGIDVPVLLLSARDEELDKVRGFRLGADDYVTKPFGVLELLARIEALLRRPGRARASAPTTFRFGAIVVDTATRVVRNDGALVDIAPLEYDLLLALLQRAGAAVSRHDLLVKVWGHAGKVQTRTVDTHIAQLRRKLEVLPARPVHILTVRKFGYRIEI